MVNMPQKCCGPSRRSYIAFAVASIAGNSNSNSKAAKVASLNLAAIISFPLCKTFVGG
jgi:hypothetical protein